MQREWCVEIDWAPYLLDPSIPAEGRSREPRNKPASPKSQLTERGERLGIEFRSGRTFTPNSLLALQASAFARDFGTREQQLEFHKIMFKAHFTDLNSLGEQMLLNDLGTSVGFDGSALSDALASEHYLKQVKEEIDWARKIGVTSIPTFIFDNQYAVVGAQEYEVLEQVAENLGLKRRVTPNDER